MGRIKLTKGELKKQRDHLKQYERYLPILQLKKQKLQMEILHEVVILKERKERESAIRRSVEHWAGILTDRSFDIKKWVVPKNIKIDEKNIAGIDVPVFNRAEFETAEYDLFTAPLWADGAIETLRELISLQKEIMTIEDGISVLRKELRITTQRVNLFEKIKIPEASEAIRRIKIYIGDQMANAVGRSKIAKRKIEEAMLQGAPL